MTEKRKEELLARVLRGFAECSDGVETYRFLHDDFGTQTRNWSNVGWIGCESISDTSGRRERRSENMQICSTGCSLRPDVYTTALWMGFAEEIADGAESSFEQEANALVAVFREISKRLSPRAVETVYQAIHAPSQCAVK